jgi:ParB family chromosome partitioning protein
MTEESIGRSRLGRGLALLIGDSASQSESSPPPQRYVATDSLLPNPNNPRQSFEGLEFEHLVESVREHGILQPIIVRNLTTLPLPASYEIIAGERRWRAAQRVGLKEVPIWTIEANDRYSCELAIIENVQRTDLNPIEEAQGYANLIEHFSRSQTDLAHIVGKSRSSIANSLRLLNLPNRVKDLICQGKISAGHARALLAVRNPEAVAQHIIDQSLSVRDVELIAHKEAKADSSPPKKSKHLEKDVILRTFEYSLTQSMGAPVTIQTRHRGGEIRIKYKTREHLEQICTRLKTP